MGADSGGLEPNFASFKRHDPSAAVGAAKKPRHERFVDADLVKYVSARQLPD